MPEKDKKQVDKINTNKYKSQLSDLSTVERETNNRIYGISNDFLVKNKEDFVKIKNVITNINQKQTEVTGPGLIEFFTKMVYEDDKAKNKQPKTLAKNQAESTKTSEAFKRSLEAANNTGMINNIFFQEKERIKLYDEYRMVDYYIPQVHQAIEAITDSIISPDDYSKQVFEITYNGEANSDNTTNKLIIENIKRLEAQYKIEDKTKKWIMETVTVGDKFVAFLDYKTEFSSILTEDVEILNESIMLNESNFSLSNEEISLLEETFLLEGEEKGTINWQNEVMNLVNSNVSFTTNTTALFEDEKQMVKDFTFTSDSFSTDTFESIKNNVLKNQGLKPKKKDIKNHEERINTLNKTIEDQVKNTGYVEKKDSPLDINGTYIKELEADKVIKLKMNSTCFGYYYLDVDSERLRNLTMQGVSNSRFTQLQMNKNLEFMETDDALANPKTKLMVDLFARALATKLNKKFIEDNKEFKKVIYELIRQDFVMQKKVRLVFLAPEQVEHFMIEEAPDGYGVSVLSKVLFTCKLYLAVLLSTLMMKLSRSVDHRAFYVETGLSKDVENVIQSFIRDIKTKEIKMSDVQTIDTIFKSMGQFSDYFIPTVNGERPVEFEIISGQDVNMEDDFLEYLRKTIISGMGVPSSYINYHDEIDFSRSIAMQNSRFLRSIVIKQKALNESFSRVYRRLYKNEYDNEQHVTDVFIDKINVNFPSPATLNMTNLADQISTSQNIIDFVVQTLVGDSPDDNEQDVVRKLVTKKMVPSIDWEMYEKLIEESKIDRVLDKVTDKSEEEPTDF